MSPPASSTTSRRRSTLGLRTIWINRLGEEAEPQPDVELRSLAGLADSLDSLVPVNVRPITPDDFPALAAFLAEDETHLFGRPSRVGLPDVTAWLTGPDLAHDSWLFEEGGGLVALGWVERHDDTGIAVGVVHRERRGRGLGSTLVDRSEERLRALGAARIHNVHPRPGRRQRRRCWNSAATARCAASGT